MKKFRIQSFVLILLAFVLGFSEFIIVGILDDIAQQFSVDISVVGYLVTIFALVYAVSTPIVTSLIKSNLYRALLLLMGIFTFGNLLTALSPTYSVLVISRVVTAIVSGAAISLAMTFATVIAPLERRAWLVSWIFPVLALHRFLVYRWELGSVRLLAGVKLSIRSQLSVC